MLSTVAPPHRLTVHDVLRMVEAEILDEDDRVELVDGVLVEMSPIGPEHSGAVVWLNRHFSRVGSEEWDVAVQDMLVTRGGLGFVMPDLLLIPRIPRSELAKSALLVIEVAHTFQRRDREKATEYAAAGVPDYWIVDLEAQRVTVCREPGADGYAAVTTHAVDDEIVPLVDAPSVSVSALLGL